MQVSHQLPCRTTIWVVAIAQDLAQDRLRADVIGLRDARFGQNDSALAKPLDGFVVRFSRDHGVRQVPDGGLKFFVRERIIFRLHRSFALGQGRFALRYGALAALNFTLRDVIHILGKVGRAKDRQRYGGYEV